MSNIHAMSNIHTLPMNSASDDLLVERLFQLSAKNELAAPEASQLDDLMMQRLIQTYGEPVVAQELRSFAG